MNMIKQFVCIVILALVFTTKAFAQPLPGSGPGEPPGTKPEPITASKKEATPTNPNAGPAVEGNEFEMQEEEEPRITKKEAYKKIALDILTVLLAPKEKRPKQRTRGDQFNDICNTVGNGYRGPCSFYQFTNSDFPSKKNSCGQAAIASALWAVGLKNNYSSQKELASSIWGFAPPKITLGNLVQVQGSLGTDWRQVNYALDGYAKLYGIKYAWVDGVSEIKKYLDMKLPVMIMLDCGTLPQYNYQWWTGHWVTAFGYDKDNIYVSNFPNNRMSWKELDDAYRKGTLAVGHGTSGRACVVWK